MLPHKHTRLVGRAVQKAMRLRGGGSALPGLVVEKLDPHFLRRSLSSLPHGVVVVSGTNGKTTTTKMIAQLLRSQGLTVFTNPSGSNFTRGIVAALLSEVDDHGVLKADIAVIELDEAHAVQFVKKVAPSYSLILNVLRDQLDRFGEIDHTARLLKTVVEHTTTGVVLNREDTLVQGLSASVPTSKKLQYFGLTDELTKLFPSDADLHGTGTTGATAIVHPHRGDVILSSLKDQSAVFSFGDKAQKPTKLKLSGVYNVLNAAAALAMVRMVLGDDADTNALLTEMSQVKPAFGRGEAIEIDGKPLEIVLVKNPAGFRLALGSYAKKAASTMIAINDNYADGRDMSWLWDVDFASLQKQNVNMISGVRAYDMALRLQYDEVETAHVIPDLAEALTKFIAGTTGPRRIYCTYTAMLKLRRELARTYPVEAIE